MMRPEYPNPQFERENWINLNGEWDFEFDFGCSGIERNVYEKSSFDKKINVPFCPESKLSGIQYTDFMNGVWYLRKFHVPESWGKGRVFICFGAVDYKAYVFINGKQAGVHTGGYTSFKIDITEYLISGENTVCVYAEDNNRQGTQPKGKQAHKYYSKGCDYTRTTGIWQTVWLEYTPKAYIKNFKFYPDINNCKLSFKAETVGCGELTVNTFYEGRNTGKVTLMTMGGEVSGEIKLSERQLWEAGHGRLYDVELCFGEDKVKSYFGLRDIRIEGKKILINGKSVFQRLVLDQGYYRDGIYTAPSEEDLIKDIKLSLDAGFNGARLHEKVFEARFLYHCDKMGYLVWGEYPNWGIDYSRPENTATYLKEWYEAVERDFNHPSIIGWCPFNETWDYEGRMQWNPMISTVYHMTKSWDSTRPCIDTSGNYHTDTDIYDVHDYCQIPEEFEKHFEKMAEGEILEFLPNNKRQKYENYKHLPVFVSEYGGICWDYDKTEGWGYGQRPKTVEEFINRYRDLTNILLDNEYMFGFCYTQLYDIEQEINGLYNYDRIPKFDISIFKEINSRKAKIED